MKYVPALGMEQASTRWGHGPQVNQAQGRNSSSRKMGTEHLANGAKRARSSDLELREVRGAKKAIVLVCVVKRLCCHVGNVSQ
jgi:hypothetical protein